MRAHVACLEAFRSHTTRSSLSLSSLSRRLTRLCVSLSPHDLPLLAPQHMLRVLGHLIRAHLGASLASASTNPASTNSSMRRRSTRMREA